MHVVEYREKNVELEKEKFKNGIAICKGYISIKVSLKYQLKKICNVKEAKTSK